MKDLHRFEGYVLWINFLKNYNSNRTFCAEELVHGSQEDWTRC